MSNLQGYSIPNSNFWSKDSISTIITGKWQKTIEKQKLKPENLQRKAKFLQHERLHYTDRH